MWHIGKHIESYQVISHLTLYFFFFFFTKNVCQLLRIVGATWSAWRIPTAVLSVWFTLDKIKLDRKVRFVSRLAWLSGNRNTSQCVRKVLYLNIPKPIRLTKNFVTFKLSHVAQFRVSITTMGTEDFGSSWSFSANLSLLSGWQHRVDETYIAHVSDILIVSIFKMESISYFQFHYNSFISGNATVRSPLKLR
jgi:hypothetical protein